MRIELNEDNGILIVQFLLDEGIFYFNPYSPVTSLYEADYENLDDTFKDFYQRVELETYASTTEWLSKVKETFASMDVTIDTASRGYMMVAWKANESNIAYKQWVEVTETNMREIRKELASKDGEVTLEEAHSDSFITYSYSIGDVKQPASLTILRTTELSWYYVIYEDNFEDKPVVQCKLMHGDELLSLYGKNKNFRLP